MPVCQHNVVFHYCSSSSRVYITIYAALFPRSSRTHLFTRRHLGASTQHKSVVHAALAVLASKNDLSARALAAKSFHQCRVTQNACAGPGKALTALELQQRLLLLSVASELSASGKTSSTPASASITSRSSSGRCWMMRELPPLSRSQPYVCMRLLPPTAECRDTRSSQHSQRHIRFSRIRSSFFTNRWQRC